MSSMHFLIKTQSNNDFNRVPISHNQLCSTRLPKVIFITRMSHLKEAIDLVWWYSGRAETLNICLSTCAPYFSYLFIITTKAELT